jgi:rhodanese-related sulfurtransferase
MTLRAGATGQALALVFGALALVSSAAAQSPSILKATLAEANARTGEVDTEEMRRIVASGSALILDTRSRAEFAAGHIPGAVVAGPGGNSVSQVEKLAGGDKTKPLVLYCNGPFCQASRRLADQLADAGFTRVRRYQLGIPVWRALGGPTQVELDGIKRIHDVDRTAVFVDARDAAEFAKGSIPGARSAPVADLAAGKLKKVDLPEDDFNTRVILFGRDGAQARQLADMQSTRPWHNVMYFGGTFAELAAAVKPGQ